LELTPDGVAREASFFHVFQLSAIVRRGPGKLALRLCEWRFDGELLIFQQFACVWISDVFQVLVLLSLRKTIYAIRILFAAKLLAYCRSTRFSDGKFEFRS
jgi:hypothetical protein